MDAIPSAVKGKAIRYQSASSPLQSNSLPPNRPLRKAAGGDRTASVLSSLEKNRTTEQRSETESNVSRYRKVQSDGSTSDELVFSWVNYATESASLIVYRSTRERCISSCLCIDIDSPLQSFLRLQYTAIQQYTAKPFRLNAMIPSIPYYHDILTVYCGHSIE